ncbi:hypothetical protein SAMN05192558_109220 [Actinokineospora alba]|uniref:Uncharacterized protein n=1 Tax=Actinokineospora alba TaxID=504798 RepID=A0A1H0T2J3_9PSEU|nr:hypothetical protein [Actinokineospora alba]TDP66413.1 hypothetical protein C8E96_1920 [Actinokineospora alba]SDJ24507.1 hypothetical protein SAMN05421871_111154 [Actinokineospora alba]SDP47930.1 hypothetical protein SAMN05192558_109220 [Actinokineospora alba]
MPQTECPDALVHPELFAILESALGDRSGEGEAAKVLVNIALRCDDLRFIEHCCLTLGTRAVVGSPLLGLAGLCLGHAARRFGSLSEASVALVGALACRAEADPADVDTRVLDGRDDMRSFLSRARWSVMTGAELLVLRERADAGDETAVENLVARAAELGDVDDLRRFADKGIAAAAERLIELAYWREDLDELRRFADNGYSSAVDYLAE